MFMRFGRVLASQSPKLSKHYIVPTIMPSTTFALHKIYKRTMSQQLSKSDFEPSWKLQKPTTDLDKVGCHVEIRNGFSNVVRYLQNPQSFIDAGIQAPRGIILSGPPGTGKTMMAEAVAGQAGVPVIITSGSEFISPFIGDTESNLRKLFKFVTQNMP